MSATMTAPGRVRLSLTMAHDEYLAIKAYADAEHMPVQILLIRALYQYMARYPRDGQGKAVGRRTVSGHDKGPKGAVPLQSCSPEGK